MKNKLFTLVIVCVVSMAAVAVSFFMGFRDHTALGSVQTGEGCQATTTPLGVGATTAVLRSGPGTLCSVIVTGPNTGKIDLYDATTSDITLRGNVATTTLLIASFPILATSTTQTFDVTLRYGLLYVGSGSVATTTITWK